jgi:hypothetical protein
VNPLQGTVRITEAISEVNGRLIMGAVKTKGSKRTIHMPEPVTEALKAHLKAFPPGEEGFGLHCS